MDWVVEFMAQQVVVRWERQGKERGGGDWCEVNAELIGNAHNKPWETTCLDYPMIE